MLCSYDSFINCLRNKGIAIEHPAAKCPRHMDSVCLSNSGSCAVGNARNCVQWCYFFWDGGLFSVSVTFVFSQNSREGFLNLDSLSMKRIINRGIVSASELDILA